MPFILWQLWLFIAPGLHENEKEMVKPFVWWFNNVYCWSTIRYYIVTPFGFQFFDNVWSFFLSSLIWQIMFGIFFPQILGGFWE